MMHDSQYSTPIRTRRFLRSSSPAASQLRLLIGVELLLRRIAMKNEMSLACKHAVSFHSSRQL